MIRMQNQNLIKRAIPSSSLKKNIYTSKEFQDMSNLLRSFPAYEKEIIENIVLDIQIRVNENPRAVRVSEENIDALNNLLNKYNLPTHMVYFYLESLIELAIPRHPEIFRKSVNTKKINDVLDFIKAVPEQHSIINAEDGRCSYIGELKDDYIPHGFGRVQFHKNEEYYSSGDVYEGRIHLGRPAVYGNIKFANNNIYTGQIGSNAYPHGEGTLTCMKGDIYEGTFSEGEIISGEIRFNNGDIYKGVFSKGQPNGFGLLSYSTGEIYEGFFKTINGDIICEFLSNSAMIRFANGMGFYIGTLNKNKPNGFGRIEFLNGDQYEGQFVLGEKHGLGILKTKSGFEYNVIYQKDWIIYKSEDIAGKKFFKCQLDKNDVNHILDVCVNSKINLEPNAVIDFSGEELNFWNNQKVLHQNMRKPSEEEIESEDDIDVEALEKKLERL